MSRRALPLLLVLAAGCSRDEKPWSIAAAAPETLRQTPHGAVIGGEGRYGSHAWLGIPFAASPVGELRWRSPKPAAPWTGTREALSFASMCMQYASPLGGNTRGEPGELSGSEDCLYVNVWAPKFAPDKVPHAGDRLPVMVWIHGGGNSIGTSAFYDGGNLASTEGVIVVSLQYRLGPFGWFHHKALASGPDEASGNFGTLDMIQALHWVKENVAAFGGNPDNVTIFGESAGGMNVYSLLMAPGAKGLFQHAIVQSGGLSHTTVAEAENFVDDADPGQKNSSNEVLLRILGEKERAAGKARLASMSADEIARLLRAQPPAKVFASYDSPPKKGMIAMPLVIRDGAVLPSDDWLEHFSDTQRWNAVPVILGTNRDEMKLFLAIDPNRVWRLFGVIPQLIDEPDYMATAEYMSRSWKAGAVDGPATVMRKAGHAGVFAYRFDWHGEPKVMGADLSRIVGAAHSLEIPFVFGHFHMGRLGSVLFDEHTALERQALSTSMMAYWTQFAATGDPGSGRRSDQRPWTAWDDSSPTAPRYMVFDAPGSGGIRPASEIETTQKIVADLDADTRVPTPLKKCRIFHDLAGWTHGIPKASYVKPGQTSCAEFPFDDYPWDKR